MMLQGKFLTSVEQEPTPIEMLAEEIVLESVEEYRHALEMDADEPENLKWFMKLMDLEDFFHSDAFASLCDIDPEYLLNRLWEESRKNR